MKSLRNQGRSLAPSAPNAIALSEDITFVHDRVPAKHHKKVVAKKIIKVAFLIAMFTFPVAAQVVEHGTYFVAGFSTEYGVVAIDSRELHGPEIDDRYCKIRLLSPTAFFFSRGVTSATYNLINSVMFDARDVALSVYERSEKQVVGFDGVAQEWASEIQRIYSQSAVEFGRSAVNNIMTDGFFVGTGMDGKIEFAGRRITYQMFGAPAFVISPQPVVFRDPTDFPTYAAGYREIIAEFENGGTTARARAVLAQLGMIRPGPDGIAALYSAYVGAVRDWSGEKGIGGDVATIIIERGKGWRWYHRPDFCPEN